MRNQKEKRDEKINPEKLLADKDVNYIRALLVDYVESLSRKELLAFLKKVHGKRLSAILHPIIRTWERKGKIW